MTESMKWKSEFTGQEGTIEWEQSDEMANWQLTLMRAEAKEKQQRAVQEQREIALAFYRQFIRNEV